MFTSDNRDALRTVAPLAIPDFRLYGESIGMVAQAHEFSVDAPESLDMFKHDLPRNAN